MVNYSVIWFFSHPGGSGVIDENTTADWGAQVFGIKKDNPKAKSFYQGVMYDQRRFSANTSFYDEFWHGSYKLADTIGIETLLGWANDHVSVRFVFHYTFAEQGISPIHDTYPPKRLVEEGKGFVPLALTIMMTEAEWPKFKALVENEPNQAMLFLQKLFPEMITYDAGDQSRGKIIVVAPTKLVIKDRANS